MTEAWRPQRPEVRSLLEQSERTVPFLGAGMSIPAGLPGGMALAELLRESELGFGNGQFSSANNPLQVADDLLAQGVALADLQAFVAGQYDLSARDARPTPALRALARAPSGLIVTLNYDELVEEAGRLQGLDPISFTWRNLPYPEDLEVGAAHELFVVHLHGIASEPESLVLDNESYREISNNADVADFLGKLLAFHNAWFLGTRLDETYLQNLMLSWRRKRPRHVLIDHVPGIEEATTQRAPVSEHHHGVYTESFPEGRFDMLDEFCEHLVQPRERPEQAAAAARPAAVEARPEERAEAPAPAPAPDATSFLVDFAGAREWTHNALRDLTAAYPEEAAQLRAELDVEDVAARVRELTASPPDWVANGSWQLWVALARFAEQDGQWAVAQDAWANTATRPEAEAARWLVNAALAAGIAGDQDARRRYLDRAREHDDRHPRLLLEEAAEVEDPEERLRALEPLLGEEGDVGALANVHAVVACLQEGDFDAAERFFEAAHTAKPELKQVRIAEANIAIHRARVAATQGDRIDYQGLARAKEDALSIREELLEQRRFEESTRLLMLGADATAIGGDFDEAGRLLATSTPEERASPDAAHILAEAALRDQQPGVAEQFLDPEDSTDLGRRLTAQVALGVGDDDAKREALGELDALVRTSESERRNAALIRVSRTPNVPEADWSDEVETVLQREGESQAVLVFKALWLAARGDGEGARETLQPYARERWALEALLHIAELAEADEEAATVAEDLLAAGPDQGTRLECALALGRAGKRKRARAEFAAVAQDEGASPQQRALAYFYLVGFAIDDERDYPAALKLLDKWRALGGLDPREVWARVWVLHRLARHEEALDVLLGSGLEPRDRQDAGLAATLFARLPDRVEGLRRITELADRFGGEDEDLERIALLHALHAGAAEDLPPELVERVRLDRFVEKFPESDLAKGGVTLDEVRQLVKQRAERDQEAWQGVLDGEVATAAFASLVSLDTGATWMRMPRLPLGFGLTALDARERLAAREALRTGAVWDATAIFTLGGLGGNVLARALEAFGTSSCIAQSTLDDVSEGDARATAEKASGEREQLALDEKGELVRLAWAKEEVERDHHRARRMLELAQQLGPIPDVAPAAAAPEDQLLDEVDSTVFRALVATYLVGRRRKLPVYSDDRYVRALMVRTGIPTFGTPALLDALAAEGMLDEATVDEARERLRRSGAQGVTVRLEELVREFEAHRGEPTGRLHVALLDPAPWAADYTRQLLRLIDFLRHVNFNKPELLDVWTARLLDTMVDSVGIHRADAPTIPVSNTERLRYHSAWLLAGAMLSTSPAATPGGFVRGLRLALEQALELLDLSHDPFDEALQVVDAQLRRRGSPPGRLPIAVLAQLPFRDQMEVLGVEEGTLRYERGHFERFLPPPRLPEVRSRLDRAELAPPGGRRRRRRR